MKALATAFSVLLAAGVAFAQSTTPPASGQPPSTGSGTMDKDKPAMADSKEKEFKAEIVAIDADAKTITVKKAGATAADTGTPLTYTVDTKADLKKVKAGDHVKLVCKTDDTGKEIVKRIEKVDARPASDTPPTP